MYFHSFTFDMYNDSPDMEVLDFEYGRSNETGTCAYKPGVSRGESYMRHGASGFMPQGEFLYVKWRNKSTGLVYEDRVDLRDRLPADITGYTITFFMKGLQLYVYLISPKSEKRLDSQTKGPIEKYHSSRYKQYEIYPIQPDLRFLDSNNTTTSGR